MKEFQVSQDQIRTLLTTIREGQIRMEGTLKELSNKVCSSPGLCLELQKTVKEHETLVQQAKGLQSAGKMLWAFIGAGGIGFLSMAYHILTSTPLK